MVNCNDFFWMFRSKNETPESKKTAKNHNLCSLCVKDIDELDYLVCLNCPSRYHMVCKKYMPTSKVKYLKSSVNSKFIKCKKCNSLGTIFLQSQLDKAINLATLLKL